MGSIQSSCCSHGKSGDRFVADDVDDNVPQVDDAPLCGGSAKASAEERACERAPAEAKEAEGRKGRQIDQDVGARIYGSVSGGYPLKLLRRRGP